MLVRHQTLEPGEGLVCLQDGSFELESKNCEKQRCVTEGRYVVEFNSDSGISDRQGFQYVVIKLLSILKGFLFKDVHKRLRGCGVIGHTCPHQGTFY